MTSFRKGAAVIAVMLVAAGVGGCGAGSATPAPSLLTDPGAVVSTSLERLEAASTFHVHGPLSGSVDPNAASALLGGGPTGLSGKLKLDGGSIDGDFDMVQQAFHVSAALPSLFGSSIDAILVGGFAYTKVATPLSPSGALYSRSRVQTSEPASSAAAGSSFGTAGIVDQLVSALAASGATATIVGQGTIDGRAAYQISEAVPSEFLERELQAVGVSPAAATGMALAPVEYWVYDDTLQPASIRVSVSSPSVGDMLVVLVLSAYDRPVTIQAPPEDQISPG